MAPLNLGERITLAAEALRVRASRATTVLGHTRAALDSRQVVDQATGMLMHRYNLNREAALEVLRRRARNADAQVHEVAAEMVREADSSGQALPPVADC
jgi:AmiR/NasT family two-component response regulator